MFQQKCELHPTGSYWRPCGEALGMMGHFWLEVTIISFVSDIKLLLIKNIIFAILNIIFIVYVVYICVSYIRISIGRPQKSITSLYSGSRCQSGNICQIDIVSVHTFHLNQFQDKP